LTSAFPVAATRFALGAIASQYKKYAEYYSKVAVLIRYSN
jgi:hypothetical protein